MAIHRAWKRPWNKALRRVASSLGLVCCQVAETCLTFFQSRKSPCQCVGALAKTFTNRAELTVCSWRPTSSTISEFVTLSTEESVERSYSTYLSS